MFAIIDVFRLDRRCSSSLLEIFAPHLKVSIYWKNVYSTGSSTVGKEVRPVALVSLTGVKNFEKSFPNAF